MTTDINGTVVGIQGNPVVSQTLGASQDGYVLTWDNADGYIVARPVPAQSGTLNNNAYFTSSGTWTCPAGVTGVLCIGAGGGGGGGSGSGANRGGGGGGGGSIQQTAYVQVSPGTVYTISIGAGGSGGASVNSSTDQGNSGSDGGSTTVVASSVNYFNANGGGGGAFGYWWADGSWSGTSFPNAVATWNYNVGSEMATLPQLPAFGGVGSQYDDGALGSSGFANVIGTGIGGSLGTNGGGGGGAGPKGNGGNGGAYGNGGNGFAGSSASANTGAGGGGGGAAYGNGNSGAGGNGGSGYLYIVW